MDNGFLFSNMAPQFENFNRKVWQRLEAQVHNWAITSNGLFVITGAVFDRDGDGVRDADDDAVRMAPRNRVAVPSHFYKIVIHVRASGVADTKSFILPHDRKSSTNNNDYLASKIVSIDEIEGVTGIDFFPDMEDERQDDRSGESEWLDRLVCVLGWLEVVGRAFMDRILFLSQLIISLCASIGSLSRTAFA